MKKLFVLLFLLVVGSAIAYSQCRTGTKSTFDPSRNTSGTVTLQAGNQIATSTNTSGADTPVFTTKFLGLGKENYRFLIKQCVTGGNCGVGVANGAASSASGAFLGGDANSIGVYGNGQTWIQGVQSAGIMFYPGDIIDLQLNMGAGTLGVLRNGTLATTLSLGTLLGQELSPAVDVKAAGDSIIFNGFSPPAFSLYAAWDAITETFGNGGSNWPFTSQVNMVNYDQGGNGVGFSHTYFNGACLSGQSYRTDFTNFNIIADSGVTLDVACFNSTSDYLNFTTSIPTTGSHTINLRAGEGNAGASWDVYVDNAKVVNIPIPNTGGYQTFQTITSNSFVASQGSHLLRLQCSSVDAVNSVCGDIVYWQGDQVSTGNVAAVTLTNGPPNITYAATSNCTISTCTWIQAGLPAGSPVSDVYADMSPMSQNYTGSYSLSGSSSFAISNTTDGAGRSVGHITTVGTVGAGDYDVTVTAGSQSQRTTIHAATCTSSPSPGTDTIPTISGVVCLGNGTYNVSHSVNVASNGVLLGRYGQSIVDGTNETDNLFIDPVSASATNGLVNGVTFQNSQNNFGPLETNTGWVISNNVVKNTHASAVYVQGGATIVNNSFTNLGYAGIHGGAPGLVSIIGNEIAGCNQGHFDIYNDVGCMGKMAGAQGAVVEKNNYIHDSLASSVWFDFSSGGPFTIQGNTVIGGAGGLAFEVSAGPLDVSFNVFKNNNADNSNTTCFGAFCPSSLGNLFIRASQTANVHDNNILVPVAGPAGGTNNGLRVDAEQGREPNNNTNNVPFYRNTVTFADDSGQYGYQGGDPTSGFSDGIGTCATGSESATSPTCSNDNTFYVQTGNTGAAHFQWAQNSSLAAFNTYQTNTGQDANSQLLTGSAGIASGCTHVACSGSGVGTGGAPTGGGSGSGIAFDYGPNGTMPSGQAGIDVAAAGFTHGVLNADFTSGAAGGSVLSLNMANKNTFVNECAGTSVFGRFWIKFNRFDGMNQDEGGDVSCSRINLVTDGATGTVLQYSFNSADDQGSGSHNGVGLYWPQCGNQCSPSVALPSAIYVEETFRMTSGAGQGQTAMVLSLDSMGIYDADPNSGAQYQDFVSLEALANNHPATGWMIDQRDVNGPPCVPNNQCSAGFIGAPDLGNYHKVATLVTTDGTQMVACQYYDDVGMNSAGFSTQAFNGASVDGTYCQHLINWQNNSLNAHDRRIQIGIGHLPTDPALTSFPLTVNVKSIKVLACANYTGRGNNCQGTVVFH